MARTPTRTPAPTRAPARAPAAAPTRPAPTRGVPEYAQHLMATGASGASEQPQIALPRISQADMRNAAASGSQQAANLMRTIGNQSAAARAVPPMPATARQTQPLPPSGARQTQPLPPAVARGIGATQQAAAASRMPAKTGAPLPSGMSIGGGQPTPPSRTGGGQPTPPSRMPAKTGAPLPSGMGMGGGQPTPPSRTGGGMPTMAGGAGGMKKGGKVKKMAKGGSVSSASKRGDGCATKGKTKGRFV